MKWLPPFVLGLWGAVLLQAWGSGRLNLLLQADFHWLVLVSGLLLLALAVVLVVLQMQKAIQQDRIL